MGTVPELQVEATRRGDALVVAATGEIDIATTPLVADALHPGGDGPPATVLVLDLREVTFLDTSGLRLITQEVNEARASGHGFHVVRGPSRVQRIFEIAGLAQAPFWIDDPGEALAGDGAPPAA